MTKDLTFGTTQLADKSLLVAALEKVGLTTIRESGESIQASDKWGYNIILTKTETGYTLQTRDMETLDYRHGGNFVAALKKSYNEGMVLKLLAKTKGKVVERKSAETTRVVIQF